tara:strand:+ start:30 stop:260 length:231 start_codon:yes stop_codon:yes gene_type:complete
MGQKTERREMLEVKVRDNNVDKAMRKLKKKLDKEGVMWELRQRRYYEKPSLKKLRKKKESMRRVAKLKRLKEQESF